MLYPSSRAGYGLSTTNLSVLVPTPGQRHGGAGEWRCGARVGSRIDDMLNLATARGLTGSAATEFVARHISQYESDAYVAKGKSSTRITPSGKCKSTREDSGVMAQNTAYLAGDEQHETPNSRHHEAGRVLKRERQRAIVMAAVKGGAMSSADARRLGFKVPSSLFQGE